MARPLLILVAVAVAAAGCTKLEISDPPARVEADAAAESASPTGASDGGADASATPMDAAIEASSCEAGAVRPCTTSCGSPGESACTGGGFGPCAPKAGDTCSGLDCKGKGDGVEHTYYRDGDGDGHGVSTSAKQACTAPTGYSTMADDCDDTKDTVHPGIAEKCDLVDDDCNGKCDDVGGCRVGMHRFVMGSSRWWATDSSEPLARGYKLDKENDWYLYKAASTGLTALRRCMDASPVYTTRVDCEWLPDGGIAGYVTTAAACGSVPLYRLYDFESAEHLFTTDAAERSSAMASGWLDEGIAGYVWKTPAGT